MAFLLTGYALLGRTFARLNAGPVYIGEIALVVLLTTALAHGDWRALWRSWATRLLLLFALWGAVRTVPFLSTYGWDALRDAAVWGYGAFAVAVAGLLIRHGSPETVIRTYRKLGAIFLPWLVLLAAVRLLKWGGALTEELLPEGALKAGDVSVHLAGIACFVGLRLHRRASSAHGRGWLAEWLIWCGWAVSFFTLWNAEPRRIAQHTRPFIAGPRAVAGRRVGEGTVHRPCGDDPVCDLRTRPKNQAQSLSSASGRQPFKRCRRREPIFRRDPAMAAELLA